MSAGQLHFWVDGYNWDDGLAPMWPIVRCPQTEFATALLIYWRLGGPWLEESAGAVNSEAYRLQSLVKTQLLSGFYVIGNSRFAHRVVSNPDAVDQSINAGKRREIAAYLVLDDSVTSFNKPRLVLKRH